MDWFDASVAAAWWGYAEAEPSLVGVVVGVIAALAVAHVVRRVLDERRQSRRAAHRHGPGARRQERSR